ncbi:MAG: hypothetical protein KIT27_05040 [Legionellales bacterium]|nr:hypothetical protein [Legionellales bacterium]
MQQQSKLVTQNSEVLSGLNALNSSSFPIHWQLATAITTTILRITIQFREESLGKKIPQTKNAYYQFSTFPKPIIVTQKSVANAIFFNEFPQNALLSRIRHDIPGKKAGPELLISDLPIPKGLKAIQKELSFAEFWEAVENGDITITAINNQTIEFRYPAWNKNINACEDHQNTDITFILNFESEANTKNNQLRKLIAEHCKDEFPPEATILSRMQSSQNLPDNFKEPLRVIYEFLIKHKTSHSGFLLSMRVTQNNETPYVEPVTVLAHKRTGLIIRSDCDFQGISCFKTPWREFAENPISLLKENTDEVNKKAQADIVNAIKHFWKISKKKLSLHEPDEIVNFRNKILEALKNDILQDFHTTTRNRYVSLDDNDEELTKLIAEHFYSRFTHGYKPGVGSPLLIFAAVIMEFLYRTLLSKKYPALIKELSPDQLKIACNLGQHQADDQFNAVNTQKVKASPPENISAWLPRATAQQALLPNHEFDKFFSSLAHADTLLLQRFIRGLVMPLRLITHQAVITCNAWMEHTDNMVTSGQRFSVSNRYMNSAANTSSSSSASSANTTDLDLTKKDWSRYFSHVTPTRPTPSTPRGTHLQEPTLPSTSSVEDYVHIAMRWLVTHGNDIFNTEKDFFVNGVDSYEAIAKQLSAIQVYSQNTSSGMTSAPPTSPATPRREDLTASSTSTNNRKVRLPPINGGSKTLLSSQQTQIVSSSSTAHSSSSINASRRVLRSSTHSPSGTISTPKPPCDSTSVTTSVAAQFSRSSALTPVRVVSSGFLPPLFFNQGSTSDQGASSTSNVDNSFAATPRRKQKKDGQTRPNAEHTLTPRRKEKG